jgi:bis(5'-adenosyl)-triphosphatase
MMPWYTLTEFPLQDGKAAGQSVPHVHFHLLPRKAIGDYFSGNNDAVYPALENGEGNLASGLKNQASHEPLTVDADEARLPRSPEEMEQEAQWLRTFFKPEDTIQL